MAIKLDWSNVGQGLTAIAKAKQERDYQEAVEKEREKFKQQREASRAEPTLMQEAPRFYGLDQQPITEDMVGPQQLPSITGRGLAPESYYALPGSEKQYQTRAEAMAARPRGPSEWEFARSKADIAEQMGLYDRAEQLRGGALKAMQAQAAEIELESKQRQAEMTDAFYGLGGGPGGVQGVLGVINNYTGGNLTAEYDEDSGKYSFFEMVPGKDGKMTKRDAGVPPMDAATALEYGLALASPEKLGAFLTSQREARIKSETQQRARDEAYAERLIDRIGALERKAAYERTPEENLELNGLRDEYFRLEQRLSGSGAGGSGLRGRVAAEIDRRKTEAGGAGGAGGPAPVAPQAGAQVGQPWLLPTPSPRGAEETKPQYSQRLGAEQAGFTQKLARLQENLSLGRGDLPAASGLARLYGYYTDTTEEGGRRDMARDIAVWASSDAGKAYFAANPDMLDMVLAGKIDVSDLYDLVATPPQQKANGGLIRRFNEGGYAGAYSKDYEQKKAAGLAKAKRTSDEWKQKNKDALADKAAADKLRGERAGAISDMGEAISNSRSTGYADDANLVYTPTVDFDMRYRAPEYLRSGGLVMKDYRKGGAVKGPGTETSDSIPARLSDGEYVVNAESMKIAGVPELLEAINKMGLQKRRAKK